MNNTNLPIWPGWETVGLIGKGSFGAVYEIQRDMLGDIEKAALKVISIPQNDSDIEELYADGFDEESITSTFRNHLKSIISEYSLMRKMNGCSNIVSCDDVRYVQHDDGIGWDIFIKMELLTALHKALPAEIPEKMVIDIGKGICTALELCKKYDIVHRDIKPQNIFVSPNGDYKLGDFGIAKTVEKTTGGTKIGTYKYMAPEVYNNQPYGSGADIYSLGLVLYWLLNERRMPFMPLPPQKLTAGMDEEARRRRLTGEALPVPAHGSDALKAIVLKACAFDPKDRYTSATEMLSELNHLGSDADVETHTVLTHSAAVSVTQEDQTLGMWGSIASHKKTGKQETDADTTVGLFAYNPGNHSAQTQQANTAVDTSDDSDRTVGIGFSSRQQTAPDPDVALRLFNQNTGKQAVQDEAATIGLFSHSTDAQEVESQPQDEDSTVGLFRSVLHPNTELKQKQPENPEAASIYKRATGIMRTGSSKLYFEEAARLFRSIGDYADAPALAAQCLAKAETAKKDEILAKADAMVDGGSEFAATYEAAIKLYESIPGWKTSDAKLRVCRTKLAAIRTEVSTKAQEAEHGKGGKRWMLLLVGLVGLAVLGVIIYFLVSSSSTNQNNITANNNIDDQLNYTLLVQPGDVISFGHYEQDANTANGAEPIEWLVLDVQGGKALVVSKYLVDTSAYHGEFAPVTWASSGIRRWLNGGFYPSAFSSTEQAQIVTTTIYPDINPIYGTRNKATTEDKVFLLSEGETAKYQNALSSLPLGHLHWWLRTPGKNLYHIAAWSYYGGLDLSGYNANMCALGVRPAMWIDLTP